MLAIPTIDRWFLSTVHCHCIPLYRDDERSMGAKKFFRHSSSPSPALQRERATLIASMLSVEHSCKDSRDVVIFNEID